MLDNDSFVKDYQVRHENKSSQGERENNSWTKLNPMCLLCILFVNLSHKGPR